MSDFIVKDSGEREQFDSGMQRDTQEGKSMFSLVFRGPMLRRWAWHLTQGAAKYTRDNWMLADGQAELERFEDSAARHFAQWINGERDEDHASAVFFNINGAEYVRERMEETPLARAQIEAGPPVMVDEETGTGYGPFGAFSIPEDDPDPTDSEWLSLVQETLDEMSRADDVRMVTDLIWSILPEGTTSEELDEEDGPFDNAFKRLLLEGYVVEGPADDTGDRTFAITPEGREFYQRLLEADEEDEASKPCDCSPAVYRLSAPSDPEEPSAQRVYLGVYSACEDSWFAWLPGTNPLQGAEKFTLSGSIVNIIELVSDDFQELLG